ncbi:MAG: SHOCT domain-containing protein [Betaproteobacteria bacterium]|jgi:putative membrane protein|nr:SHOCT domain-containing protein [Betaproteobacteria bacterium]
MLQRSTNGGVEMSNAAECWGVAGGPDGMMAMWHPAWGYMIAHGVFTLLFFVLLIGLLARLFGGPRRWRQHGGMPDGHDRSGSALRILGERFARGELDRAEFEERRSVLLKDSGLA